MTAAVTEEAALVVTYQHGANRCVLRCWFVGWRRNGGLHVAVEHRPAQGRPFRRERTIPAEELVSVEGLG